MKQILRRLIHSPLFTVLTLLTLAIGIGANSAIFSVIEGVLLKPLPYPEPDRLVGVWLKAPGLNLEEVNASPSMYFIYSEQSRTFEQMGVWGYGSVSVTGTAEPEQVDTVRVTPEILPIMGAQPVLGRLFNKTDDTPGTPETVILTHGYWQRRLGGDMSVIGRRLTLDGQPTEVIAVLPEGFRFMDTQAQMIVPLRLNRSEVRLGNFSYRGIARLKPGVTLGQASADVERMIEIEVSTFPPPPGFSVDMLRSTGMAANLRPLKKDVVGDIGSVLWVLMGTIGLVLLIACANVANLLLVRADGRSHELTIRAALGAGRGRIARELLAESVLLSLGGGVLGIGVAYSALRLLLWLQPSGLPRLRDIAIDGPVLLFTLIVSLAAGLLFGLVPVFKYVRPQLGVSLRGGGRSVSQSRERHRTRGLLVVVQVALALVLLVASGLMMRTFWALRNVHPGFVEPDAVQIVRVSVPGDPEEVIRTQQAIAEKLRALPGVVSVGVSNSVMLDYNRSTNPIYAEGHAYQEAAIAPLRIYRSVGPGYFKTLGTPLVAGRDLEWADELNRRRVVLISANLAKELWGDPASAIGKRVREGPQGEWREIIGVMADEHGDGVDKPAPKVAYWPMLVEKFWGEDVQVRHSAAFTLRSDRAGQDAFLKETRAAIWSVNNNLPVSGEETLGFIYRRSMARTSFTLVMLGIASAMALMLGVIGIYGVISYSVSQRTREIGIRMALGAREAELKTMFVRHGLLLAGIGAACGLIAAGALMRVLSGLLFGVQPLDATTYVAVTVGLVSAAMLASYLPARRATTVDPVEALRSE